LAGTDRQAIDPGNYARIEVEDTAGRTSHGVMDSSRDTV